MAEQQQVLRWYYSFDRENDLILEEGKKASLLKLASNNVFLAIGKPKSRKVFSRWKPAIGIAAVLIIAVLAGLFSYRQFFRPYGKQHAIYKELTTLAGERKIIRLSDGSKIWLNNASKLRYPEIFNSNVRTVYLDGEAFFDVAHRKNQAFIIHTRKLRVQVLGTSFNVKSFGDEKREEITVVSGKVGVAKARETQFLMLLPGEQASYILQTGYLSKDKVEPQSSIAWRNNELYFRYETLENICRQLERWYGVTIQCNNELLLAKRYTLKQKNQSLGNVLKVLGAGDFHYKMNGRIIIID